ncbi:hypothetical protein [Pedobacter aquatilis]|uniref:hypothetical protein n=1 Tax=Pedobacter aquatilis TaxID=351343 RepID=UPI00292D0EF6|nr:hypothetical protein [Pedobacter aquatilis]
MKNENRFPRIFFLITLFGIMNFLAMLSGPAWKALRGVDILRFIGTGMCFGAALVIIATYLSNRRS